MKQCGHWEQDNAVNRPLRAAVKLVRCVLAALLVVAGLASSALAQSSLPTFTCQADAFNLSGNPSSLQRFDPATRSVLSDIPLSPAVAVNSIGYNPLDNYIYGLVANNAAAPPFNNQEFARVGVDGSVESLGAPVAATAGLPAFNANVFSGTMDASGNWYGLDDVNIFIVNVGNAPAAGTLTYNVVSRSGVTAEPLDITFSPLDGALYGASGGGLVRLDPVTGSGSSIATTGVTLTNSGGAWSTSDGSLFFYRNATPSPSLFRVDLSQSPALVENLGSVPDDSNFDSAACLPPLLSKGVQSAPDASGQFAYEFTITNAFTNPITVNFNDPLPTGLQYVPGSLSPAAPGGGTVATFTANDLTINNITLPAAGSVSFEATVGITPGTPAGTVLSNQAFLDFGGTSIPSDDPDTGASNDATAITVPTPSLTIAKPAPANADEDGSGDVTFGDTLTYTITASNTGSATLNNVVVSDPLITPNSETCATLAPGADCVLTGTRSVSSADVGAGMIDNTASVQSDEVTTPITATQSTPTAFTTAPPPAGIPPVEFVDFSSPTNGSVCGGSIPVVAFSGGTNALTDLDDTFSNGATANGALTQVFVPQGPADSVNISGNAAGSITFSSPVVDPLISFYQLDDNDLTFALGAGQSVALLSSNNGQASSDPLNPTGVCDVRLVGNTLTGCAMDIPDQNTGPNSARDPDASGGPGELEGAGTIQFTGTFTAINFTSTGTTIADSTTRMAVAIDASTCSATSLSLDKPAPTNADEDGSGDVTFGDTLTYTITATNTGLITQNNVVVSDPLLDAPNSTTCATLAAGATCVLTGTHTVTAAEAAAGMVDNTASVQSDEVTTPVPASQSTSVAPVIDAQDNDFTSVPVAGGANTPTVFGNDTLNGASFAPADVTPTIVNDGGLTGVVINPDGTLTVPAGAAAGSYPVVYQICDASDATLCSTATATVVVSAAPSLSIVKPAPSNADEDGSGTVTLGDTLTYTITATNDGNAPQTNVTVSDPLLDAPNTQTCANVAVGGTCVLTGTHTVTAAEANAGMVDNTASAQSDQVTTPVSVMRTTPTNVNPIAAVPETYAPVNGADGGTLPTVLGNDTLNGSPVTPADVDLTIDSVVDPSGNPTTAISVDPATGNVTVAAGTPAGDYMVTYTICEVSNPANCDTVTETVTVAPPGISAAPETYAPVNGVDGGTLPSILGNDTLNGNPVTPADVDLTIDSVVDPSGNPTTAISVDPATGNVTVAAGTPAGDYMVTYTICDPLNPSNCDTVTETVTVAAPVIDAAPENYGPVNGATGGSLPTVLGNDTFNGGPVDPANIDLTIDSVLDPAGNPTTAISVDPVTGEVTIAAGTPEGDYTVTYTICDPLNPANCDTVTETISVALNAINADNDDFAGTPLMSGLAGTTPSVFGNDTLAGSPLDPADVTTTLTDNGGLTGASFNPDGTINVPANTPAGTFVLSYEICETANPTNCSTAMVTIVVEVMPIDAVDDDFSSAPAPAGGTTPSLFSDDTLNNGGFAPTDVTLRLISTGGLTGVTVNPDGTLNVPVNTPPGNFVVEYEICDVINPTNCDTATATITIDPPVQLFATKVASTSTASTGAIVAYTITLRNDGAATATGVEIVDTPPLGFRYVEGSGILNGVAVEPTTSGSQLSWTNVDIPAGETATVNLALIVGSGVNVGDFVNTAFAETTPGTTVLSNEAQAIVRITPDEVFDCSEVIGKVFEDRDGDGYQDQGEPGIAGARVATATGLLITTDEFGRYHIACAATPKAGIGSNFIVKLDTRSLPSGVEVTTENPRVVRLTEGKLTSADFGVTRLRSMTLDLLPSAFVGGSNDLKSDFASALTNTIVELRREPTVLTLTYEGAGGEARLEALADRIRQVWYQDEVWEELDETPYDLEIRTRVVSGTDREER